jgi:hypothetical protein
MRHTFAPPAALLILAATLVLAACDPTGGSAPGTTAPGATVAPGATASPEGSEPAGPTLTPVPGGQTTEPVPLPTVVGVVQTEWGAILAALPDSFPVHPGADLVDLPEVTTASFSVPVDLEAATGWYVEALEAKGYQLDLSDPLESGERVLDAASDLPECRIQVALRPEQDSTIISVLYGAGCAGLGG